MKILVVSRDPALADVRKAVLEAAGFQVIPATSESPISEYAKRENRDW